VGATLAFTEDSQHIQAAFRNGFLNWGALPQYVYLDNGKAFKSKLFHEQWEGHDLAKELGGIFPKLGIRAQFAESYNAKAKIIERFFRTFQEQFERFISSFRGANIADKPATLMRNEKWIKKLYTCEPPTTEEAMQMIGYYIRYVYGITPHRGLDNRKPWEVFNSAPKPQDRLVNPSQLNFMMLSVERKAIRNEGIVLNKLKYWHPALVFHMGKPVIIRYDLADARWVLVYDEADVFICQASLRQTQHPFIQADLQNSKSHKEYRQEYTQIKKLQRLTEQRTQSFVRSNQESVDKLLKSYMNEIPAENNPTFLQAPMIEAPAPGPEEEIARLEQIVIEQEKAIAASQPEQTHNDQNQAVAEGSTEFDPFDNEEFKKMLKTIGIK
jgi:putative transposase